MRNFLGRVVKIVGLCITASYGMADQVSDRPILVRTEETLKAFSADGELLVDFGDLYSPSWAPSGTQFLFFMRQQYESYFYPAIAEQSGVRRYLFPTVPEGTFLYRPIWSPNGIWVGLIRWGPAGFDFVVVDAFGMILAEGQILDQFVADFPYFTSGIDTFSWSPDSKKLMLSWQGVLVFDIESGDVQVASDGFAYAFWAPDSDGVCLLQFQWERPRPPVVEQLRKFELATSSMRDIATQEDLAFARIGQNEWNYLGPIELSPDGLSVALGIGDTETQSFEIRIYDSSENCISDLDVPRRVLEVDPVFQMEWAPESNALATLGASEGSGWALEAQVIELKTNDRVALTEFEFKEWDPDVLGITRLLAWSR